MVPDGGLEGAVGADPLYLSGYGAIRPDAWLTGTRVDFGRLATLIEMMQ